jgi:hypothetical protein
MGTERAGFDVWKGLFRLLRDLVTGADRREEEAARMRANAHRMRRRAERRRMWEEEKRRK